MEKAPISFAQWSQCGKYFEWRDHNVFFQRGGKGEVLLMIHGFPTSGWDWCWVSKRLLDRFHMIVPDLLDYGLSLNARLQTCCIADQADMLEALMKHRDVKDVHILAHDVGDTVVQELLARHNTSSLSFRIKSCIFLNGGMIPSLHKPRPMQQLLAGPFGALISRFMNKKRFLKSFSEVFGKHTQPSGDFLAEVWPAARGINGKNSFTRRIKYMAERKKNSARWVTALTEAKLPMMLINGLADPVSGSHAADGFQKLLPKAKIARLPEIGHYPQIEAPETVVDLVNRFHDCILEKTGGVQSS